ncbi:2-oxoisovalerate dehydrogenase subunit alpha 2, mitochondrial [Quillaja saponaria]|uniref:2-oxoisovalerate dehydrogenase subunit alpha 2, mitochondrial n=1 Tax=Quillaja saponaria TaxID=32244 RepID=A0AAD7M5X3_QUISA|nr:2-oxoisovalerate dehydrogenase subunit alpha 2, mitochondrial [Quillaja saponaria]
METMTEMVCSLKVLQGDFHAALNYAAFMEAIVIFICRNNGLAIGVVEEEAYEARSIRVDSNDALAWYSAVHMFILHIKWQQLIADQS